MSDQSLNHSLIGKVPNADRMIVTGNRQSSTCWVERYSDRDGARTGRPGRL
jgi:hypothetical protein